MKSNIFKLDRRLKKSLEEITLNDLENIKKDKEFSQKWYNKFKDIYFKSKNEQYRSFLHCVVFACKKLKIKYKRINSKIVDGLPETLKMFFLEDLSNVDDFLKYSLSSLFNHTGYNSNDNELVMCRQRYLREKTGEAIIANIDFSIECCFSNGCFSYLAESKKIKQQIMEIRDWAISGTDDIDYEIYCHDFDIDDYLNYEIDDTIMRANEIKKEVYKTYIYDLIDELVWYAKKENEGDEYILKLNDDIIENFEEYLKYKIDQIDLYKKLFKRAYSVLNSKGKKIVDEYGKELLKEIDD